MPSRPSAIDKYTLPAYTNLVRTDRFALHLDHANTDASLVTVIAETPQGEFEIFGQVVWAPDHIVIREFGIWGGAISGMLLRELADLVMETFDVERIEIRDSRRVAGHRQGRPIQGRPVKDRVWRRRLSR